MSRELLALGLCLGYGLLCWACWWTHRRRQRHAATLDRALAAIDPEAAPLLVLHASQTGTATALARQTAQALRAAGRPVRLAALGEIDAAALIHARQLLLIASTHGEGDPPDGAVPFARRWLAGSAAPVDATNTEADADAAPDLSHLAFGLLALGDRHYPHFCGFGRALDGWLQARGAVPLFPRLDADQADAATLAAWRAAVHRLGGTPASPAEDAAWAEAPFAPWRLVERARLNPGGQGAGLFRVVLAPTGARPTWDAGDLAQVRPPDASAPRDYTVASQPADGHLELLVRQHRGDDGRPGQVSGLLTETLAPGDALPLRLWTHPAFHLGDNAARPLVLVGNGSGLAGLLAHLRQRADAGGPACWLVYGERQAAHDTHYAPLVARWQAAGVLVRVDRVFSRDGGVRRYVQDLLAAESAELAAWLARGAAVYVCGSRDGMAAGVDAVLRAVLGEAGVDALIRQGRYRRDVY